MKMRGMKMPFYEIETWEEAERLLGGVPVARRAGPFIVPTALGLAVADALCQAKRGPANVALEKWFRKPDPLYDRVRLD